jgi:hypothetical protein
MLVKCPGSSGPESINGGSDALADEELILDEVRNETSPFDVATLA